MGLDPDVEAALKESFLSSLPGSFLASIIEDSLPLQIPAGTVLYPQEGEPRVALVVDGLLRVYMTSAEGREVTVRYARGGDVLGIAVLIGGPAATPVKAVIDSDVRMLDVKALREEAQRDPAIAWTFAEELARRLYDVLDELAGNVFGSVRQRVARHLLDLATKGPGPHLVVQATQQDIADAVGSVREVVARIVKELRDDGLIGGDRTIEILNPAGLHDVARA